MATVKVNDTEIYYELHGQGLPLILIAGYACDHLFWSAMLDDLKPHFRVLIFDNRGVGQTKDSGDAITLETIASDTIALIEKLGIKRPTILGHSMGGAIAQIIARQYGDKLNKLILLNTAAKFNKRTLLALNSLLTLRKENVSIDRLIDAVLPWLFSSDFLDNPNNIAMFTKALKSNPYPQSMQDQERQFKSLLAFDSRYWLHEIKVPTHVITAENDIMSLLSDSQQLTAGIAHADLSVISCGHSSPIERPQAVTNLIIVKHFQAEKE